MTYKLLYIPFMDILIDRCIKIFYINSRLLPRGMIHFGADDVLKEIIESWNLDYLYASFPFFAICEKLQIFGEVKGKF